MPRAAAERRLVPLRRIVLAAARRRRLPGDRRALCGGHRRGHPASRHAPAQRGAALSHPDRHALRGAHAADRLGRGAAGRDLHRKATVPGNSSAPCPACTRCRARITSPTRWSPPARTATGAAKRGRGQAFAAPPIEGLPAIPGHGTPLGALDLDVDLEQRGVAGLAELPEIDADHVVADLDIAADHVDQLFLQFRQEIGRVAAGALVRQHDLEPLLGDRGAVPVRREQVLNRPITLCRTTRGESCGARA